jgi:hypothetical protein
MQFPTEQQIQERYDSKQAMLQAVPDKPDRYLRSEGYRILSNNCKKFLMLLLTGDEFLNRLLVQIP